MYSFSVDWYTKAIPFWPETFAAADVDFSAKLHVLKTGSFEGRSALLDLG